MRILRVVTLKKRLSYPLLIVQSGCFNYPHLIFMGLMNLMLNLWVIIEFLYHKADGMSKVKAAWVYARSRGKPVLNYGCGDTDLGDVNADITRRNLPNFVLIDPSPSPTPFPDKYFGAAICSNVMEHVPDPEALRRELERVADRVFISLPNPVFAWSYFYPEHLWVFVRGKAYRIRGEAPNLERAYASDPSSELPLYK
jgi:SAM-dependent methyltransferase